MAEEFQFDLAVIGGGSGGLACAKAAAALGARVACCDFVQPSPRGTTWGLGGTCVNVGCIPKKLMHQAALLGQSLADARAYGWAVPEGVAFSWEKLVEGVQNHIGSLNWGYRVALNEASVKYYNAYATFTDPHTLSLVNKRGKVETITAKYILIATGGRPSMPDIPGTEHCISSDDLFSLPTSPGKTLVVGASYVALECAGFLAGLGLSPVVMVRSILLRGFDSQMADLIGAYMEDHGCSFVREAVPTKVEKLENGQLLVSYTQGGESKTEAFDTVLFATGRYACTNTIGLEHAGVVVDAKTGKIAASATEQTNVPHIYAIGDVLLGKPELTPVAIEAGRLLAARLFAGATTLCDYTHVPTTVYTPLEYGCCGLPEQAAIDQFGAANVEVYHQYFTPLEWTVAHRPENKCYAKLIVNKADDNRVVGLHVVGPNAGEVTQGFGIAFKLRATKADFDRLIGIHPTVAEVFTTLDLTKSSGADAAGKGC